MILSGPAALAALVEDVASGESAGSVDPGDGQSISQQAEQAVTDDVAGKASQAVNDLSHAAMTITTGVQSGKITQAEGVTLQGGLSMLATALGVSSTLTTPTTPSQPTTLTTQTAPGPGKGHGKG
jgi:hypothetical protein